MNFFLIDNSQIIQLNGNGFNLIAPIFNDKVLDKINQLSA